MSEQIEIYGAREHNLKNLDVTIPRDKLIVITGVSGSGKSSLAFDTLHSEGQRRYLESFSVYARQFIGDLKAPDVDKIEGLSPVIAIEQKTTSRNPRSTVGTVTEIYDFLRLLFARAGVARSWKSGMEMVRMTDEQIIGAIQQNLAGQRILILAPLVKGRKGNYKELFESIRKQGYSRVRVDGDVRELKSDMKLDRYKIHDIELVIDRAVVGQEPKRMEQSVTLALNSGEDTLLVINADSGAETWFSRNLMDPETGISYEVPSPNSFSFNSPYGYCPECRGLGTIQEIDPETVVPDSNLTIQGGAIAALGEYREIWMFQALRDITKAYGASLASRWADLDEECRLVILHGLDHTSKPAGAFPRSFAFEGIFTFILRQYEASPSEKIRQWAEDFMRVTTCPACEGARLRKESLHFFLNHTNIAQAASMDIHRLKAWTDALDATLSDRQRAIAKDIIKEISKRLEFLQDVGLGYLSLDRPARSLSGGEAQRIRLATQIGSRLTNVLYILDEPSIGLHQRDNVRLIRSLKQLRDVGNTVLVVEHDKDMMLEADVVIDMGPGAGIHGGHLVAQGTPAEILASNTQTGDYLSGRKHIPLPEHRRKPGERQLVLKGAKGNNLKGVDLAIPLGLFICVTGVSGSGKSSLINETLYPILHGHVYRTRTRPLPFDAIEGLEYVNKVINIDQSPIGRTPRSNPATYTNLFTLIRDFYTQLPEAKIRGYKAGRFSFNVAGGRCETCEGAGVRTIEMNFLPDMYVPCETCNGKRYNRETLEVRYQGKSISDVLSMTVSDALTFFEAHPRIRTVLQTLEDVGLGYITLGQPATTLSGGEAQRVKIATELSRKDTGDTVYILDEPTTGLHFSDIHLLVRILDRLVGKGNTVIVIEHNLDMIKVADYLIDIGPEGGAGGGMILAQGTPEEIALVPHSFTGQFLKAELAASLAVPAKQRKK